MRAGSLLLLGLPLPGLPFHLPPPPCGFFLLFYMMGPPVPSLRCVVVPATDPFPAPLLNFVEPPVNLLPEQSDQSKQKHRNLHMLFFLIDFRDDHQRPDFLVALLAQVVPFDQPPHLNKKERKEIRKKERKKQSKEEPTLLHFSNSAALLLRVLWLTRRSSCVVFGSFDSSVCAREAEYSARSHALLAMDPALRAMDAAFAAASEATDASKAFSCSSSWQISSKAFLALLKLVVEVGLTSELPTSEEASSSPHMPGLCDASIPGGCVASTSSTCDVPGAGVCMVGLASMLNELCKIAD